MENEQLTTEEVQPLALKNDLLLRAARGEQVERPPVWLMRQAGRILPQYRELRGKLSGFKELVETPELACEVTIQPIDELGVDAAIIFSDILVVPEVMGLRYEMIPGKGPMFPMTIQLEEDVDKLIAGERAALQLDYVYKAIQLTKAELNGRVPLIGFCGAPWTLMAYMIEGSGSKTFSKARRFLYKKPISSHVLLQKITDTTIDLRLTTSEVKSKPGQTSCKYLTRGRGFSLPNNTLYLPYLIFAKSATLLPKFLLPFLLKMLGLH